MIGYFLLSIINDLLLLTNILRAVVVTHWNVRAYAQTRIGRLECAAEGGGPKASQCTHGL